MIERAREPASPRPGSPEAAEQEEPENAGLLSEAQLASLERADEVQAVADRGTSGSREALPHMGRIQASFGRHDVGSVDAYVGGPAADASAALGAIAYATGGKVAFSSSPDVHTSAHEAAHVIQQRAGVSGKGGLSEPGDTYERHADAVADRVVAGQSAEMLLDEVAAGGGQVGRMVQRYDAEHREGAGEIGAEETVSSGVVVEEGPASEAEDPQLLLAAVHEAQKTITKLAQSTRAWINASETYLTRNMGRFVGHTEGATKLGFTESDAVAMVQRAIWRKGSDAATEVAKKGAGAVIGGAVGGPAGALIGIVVSAVISKAASWIAQAVTGKTKEDEAAAQAHIEGADAATDKALAVKLSFEGQRRQVDDLENELASRLEGAPSEECFAVRDDALAALANVPPAPGDDDGLFRQLLTEWVLENAADEDDAGEGIDQAQWEAAKEELEGGGVAGEGPYGEVIEGDPEFAAQKEKMFAFQARKHWAEAGIPAAEAGIIDFLMTAEELRNPGWTFQGNIDAARFATLIETETGDSAYAAEVRELGRNNGGKTRPEDIRVHCRLEIGRSTGKDGTPAFAESFGYTVTLKHTVPERLGGLIGGSPELEFSVTPD